MLGVDLYWYIGGDKNLLNYFPIYSGGCKEGKKCKISPQKYSDEGDCFLTNKEKKKLSFLCKYCYIVNYINFSVIASRETIKIIQGRK